MVRSHINVQSLAGTQWGRRKLNLFNRGREQRARSEIEQCVKRSRSKLFEVAHSKLSERLSICGADTARELSEIRKRKTRDKLAKWGYIKAEEEEEGTMQGHFANIVRGMENLTFKRQN